MAESQIGHLCCRICCQVLRNPAALPCGHTFCMQCIVSSFDRNDRDKSPCSCPECGQRFFSRPPLSKKTSASQKRSMETGGVLCRKHQRPLDVYCCTDEQVICHTCASVAHGGHTIGLVKNERKKKQEQLMTMQRKSQEILCRQERKLTDNREILTQIENKAREADDFCQSVMAGLIDSLQTHYLSVRELISDLEEKTADQVRTYVKELEQKKTAMKTRCDELDQLAQTNSDVQFLMKWPPQPYDIETDLSPDISQDTLLPFVSTKRAVEQLSSRLEALYEKEFDAIVQTVRNESQHESGEGMEEEETQQTCEAATPGSYDLFEGTSTETARYTTPVDPVTRDEFLQYACELTLDPTTAHEDLYVSENDKKVHLCPLTVKGPTLRNPERFLHRRQVLCREGLRAERCYYEVEITGGKAEIALAYKGIDRKSRTKVSAFGADGNSWSLDCSTYYSMSHKGDSVQLSVPPLHPRIGVYVEFKKGTLSFFEVSDCMKFLYKTKATFTEPLYPGFWLGEKCCIRICDLS